MADDDIREFLKKLAKVGFIKIKCRICGEEFTDGDGFFGFLNSELKFRCNKNCRNGVRI